MYYISQTENSACESRVKSCFLVELAYLLSSGCFPLYNYTTTKPWKYYVFFLHNVLLIEQKFAKKIFLSRKFVSGNQHLLYGKIHFREISKNEPDLFCLRVVISRWLGCTRMDMAASWPSACSPRRSFIATGFVWQRIMTISYVKQPSHFQPKQSLLPPTAMSRLITKLS